MLKHLLQGRPLRHPLHPILVHLPIALFFLSLLLDITSCTYLRPDLVRGAFYTMFLGIITALLAAVPGFADYSTIRRDHPGRGTATTHMTLNLAVVLLYAISLLLRRNDLDAGRAPLVPLLLSFAAAALLGYSGYLGGRLVYENGISVGRHRRKTELPADTNKPQGEKTSDGFHTLADANTLGEGQTLRAEVEGHVMAIIHLDGRFFAIQEFCTHRFGPMSEGHCENGTVQCPWHRSSFDLRTGKPVSGPAKEPLNVYEVRVEEGKIQVRVSH